MEEAAGFENQPQEWMMVEEKVLEASEVVWEAGGLVFLLKGTALEQVVSPPLEEEVVVLGVVGVGLKTSEHAEEMEVEDLEAEGKGPLVKPCHNWNNVVEGREVGSVWEEY